MKFAKRYVLVAKDSHTMNQMINPLANPDVSKPFQMKQMTDPLANPDATKAIQLNKTIVNNLANTSKSLYDKLMDHGQLTNRYQSVIRQIDQPDRDIMEQLLSNNVRQLSKYKQKDEKQEENTQESEQKTPQKKDEGSEKRRQSTRLTDKTKDLLARMTARGWTQNEDGSIKHGKMVYSPTVIDKLLNDAVAPLYAQLNQIHTHLKSLKIN